VRTSVVGEVGKIEAAPVVGDGELGVVTIALKMDVDAAGAAMGIAHGFAHNALQIVPETGTICSALAPLR
jgi:hypothetical protein